MKAGEGKGIQFLRDHINHQGDDCLIWPFHRNPQHGRGMFGFEGRIDYAHRVMCILAHGAPPPGKEQARHSCGNGHGGCVNPRHLGWGNNSQNQRDRRKHGTHVAHRYGRKGHLTATQINEMFRLRSSMTLAQLAAKFDLSEGGIRYWLKKKAA